ncbi:MAG TPA: hypothetical protein DDY31_13820 [Lachnospiraceae bacterium]|nr:hypothetical protein [Lachnospiraceae bacterium]
MFADIVKHDLTAALESSFIFMQPLELALEVHPGFILYHKNSCIYRFNAYIQSILYIFLLIKVNNKVLTRFLAFILVKMLLEVEKFIRMNF